MNSKVMLSLATVALFAATASAYDFETAKSWLSVDADSADVNAAPWDKTALSGGTVSTEGSTVDVDTASANPLKYALSGVLSNIPAGKETISITGELKGLVLNAEAPAPFTGTLPQAAITAVDAATDYWCAWHCTGESAGAWVQMTGATPVEGSDYTVTIEFKAGYVRYGIGATPTWLTHTADFVTDEDGWMLNAKTFGALNAVGLAGCGSFGDFGGMAVKTVTIDTLPTGVTAEEYDTNPDKELANGLTTRQTVLLGLESASIKPFAAPVQTTDSNTLGFTIGNVVKGNVKGYVTYTVEEYSDAACTSKTGSSAETDAGEQATITAPSEVKYYKIKINFK